ncbi:MAG: choice-of-anchor U domain-containing protein [Candidatus Krumholzibacteriia bacterium]
MSVRRVVAVLVCCLILATGAVPAPAWDNTPAVAVYVTPYGLSYAGDEAETPESPLVAEIAAGSGGNTAWGRAVPGDLKLTTAITNGAEPWSMSHAVARFADHFRLTNPAMGQDTRGTFYFRFFLTGTMSILASDWQSGATVAVGANVLNQQRGGTLTFYRVGETATLYGLSGDGGSFPPDNLFANPDGSMKVYATAPVAVDGYYTVHVNVPVAFVFTDFPINRDPALSDWLNWLQIELSVASFTNARCDFSSTFAFAPQNPIVPAPEDGALPATGWTFAAASDEIALPPVSTVATSTGTGEAAVVPDRGVIAGLTALGRDDFPVGLSGGDFAHGWFGLELTGVDPGALVVIGFTLPGPMGGGAAWWHHDGVGWQTLPLLDDDGDGFLVLLVTDDGPGDLDPDPGELLVRGGISDDVPTPGLLDAFVAAWRAGGVDLGWRAPRADPDRLALTAVLDGRTWPVAHAPDGRGGFAARDEAPALRAGGTVRYDLKLDGAVLDSRTVDLGVPILPVALVGLVPNPCNPRTEVSFTVARDMELDLAVFDLAGRRVATLASGRHGPGEHRTAWSGADLSGRAAPSGTYVVRLATAQGVQTRKLSLVR